MRTFRRVCSFRRLGKIVLFLGFVNVLFGISTYIVREYRPDQSYVDTRVKTEPLKVIPKFLSSKGRNITREESVINAIQHAWRGYEYYALDADELLPLSRTGRNNWGHLQWSLVDAVDTLHIAGLTEEYDQARKQLQQSTFRQNSLCSTFEMTIRLLGGTLAAYELTKDQLYLDKARDIGDRILLAFYTSSGMPAKSIHLVFGAPKWFSNLRGGSASQERMNSLAGVGSVQMELSHLSFLTNDPKYNDAGRRALKALKTAHGNSKHRLRGLYPLRYSIDDGKASNSRVYYTMGSGADSFYEYLLKLYILEGGKDSELLGMYLHAMDDMIQNLVMSFKFSENEFGKILVDSWDESKIKKMHHLTCFIPGLLALGAYYGKKNHISELEKRYDEHMEVAKGLMKTCSYFYTSQPTGLSAEEYGWGDSYDARSLRPTVWNYNLRPETVESLFVLYRVTGDVQYQETGWKIFKAIERYCRTDVAYAAVFDVTVRSSSKRRNIHMDKMESFLLGETLKYLQLLFSDPSKIPIDQYVFTTEAHPLPIHK